MPETGLEDLLADPIPGGADPLGQDPAQTLRREASWFGLKVTSGRRTRAEQDALIKQGKTKATNSFHLYGGDTGALDFGGSADKMQAFTEHLKTNFGPQLRELFHGKTGLKDGVDIGPVAHHDNHVHVAFGHRPGEKGLSLDDLLAPQSPQDAPTQADAQSAGPLADLLAGPQETPALRGMVPDLSGVQDTGGEQAKAAGEATVEPQKTPKTRREIVARINQIHETTKALAQEGEAGATLYGKQITPEYTTLQEKLKKLPHPVDQAMKPSAKGIPEATLDKAIRGFETLKEYAALPETSDEDRKKALDQARTIGAQLKKVGYEFDGGDWPYVKPTKEAPFYPQDLVGPHRTALVPRSAGGPAQVLPGSEATDQPQVSTLDTILGGLKKQINLGIESEPVTRAAGAAGHVFGVGSIEEAKNTIKEISPWASTKRAVDSVKNGRYLEAARDALNALEPQLQVGKHIGEAQYKEIKAAYDQWEAEGGTDTPSLKVMEHMAAGLVPIVGPAGEQALTYYRQGKYPEAVGTTVGIAALLFGPKVLRGLREGAGTEAAIMEESGGGPASTQAMIESQRKTAAVQAEATRADVMAERALDSAREQLRQARIEGLGAGSPEITALETKVTNLAAKVRGQAGEAVTPAGGGGAPAETPAEPPGQRVIQMVDARGGVVTRVIDAPALEQDAASVTNILDRVKEQPTGAVEKTLGGLPPTTTSLLDEVVAEATASGIIKSLGPADAPARTKVNAVKAKLQDLYQAAASQLGVTAPIAEKDINRAAVGLVASQTKGAKDGIDKSGVSRPGGGEAAAGAQEEKAQARATAKTATEETQVGGKSDAAQKGQEPESRQPEHKRTPPGTDSRPHEAEIRKGEGRQAGGGDRAGTETPQQEAVKQPWEMTQAEYAAPIIDALMSTYTDAGQRIPQGELDKPAYRHRQLVEEAKKAGKKIPANVLADYPDLKKGGQPSEKRDVSPPRPGQQAEAAGAATPADQSQQPGGISQASEVQGDARKNRSRAKSLRVTKGGSELPESGPAPTLSDSSLASTATGAESLPISQAGIDVNRLPATGAISVRTDLRNGAVTPVVDRVVMANVIAALHNPKIRDAVVRLIPVDVVDNLIAAKGAAKVSLHDKAVLAAASTVDADGAVSVRSDVADTIISVVADAAAKGVVTGNLGRELSKLSPASRAGTIDVRHGAVPPSGSTVSGAPGRELGAPHSIPQTKGQQHIAALQDTESRISKMSETERDAALKAHDAEEARMVEEGKAIAKRCLETGGRHTIK